MFKESITNEELAELPLRKFEGDVMVVDSVWKVKEAVEELKKHRMLGFDTETKPSFKKGVINQVALLQLSTSDKAYLFRVNMIGLPRDVAALLADEHILKGGVAIRDDIRGLQKLTRFKPAGFVELQDKAKELGITNFSLKKLAAITCGYRISKGQQLTNWEAAELTPAQMVYAATDAWVSLEILKKFLPNE